MTAQPDIQRFGRYILLHRIAVGGMAEIFLALDPGTRGEVDLLVVKRIREELSDNREFVKMFLDEERVISQLSHPNIVKLRDFGVVDGRYFIALEHVWGESLSTLARICAERKSAFPLFTALYIALKVAAALQHAHEHRTPAGAPAPVIHRDVTLGNVVISYQGEVKILDFGIAKARDRLVKTQAGQIKGTLAYLAPEQLLAGEVGPATDVYQLGVLLYQLLVGRAPVAASGEVELMKGIVAGNIVKPSAVAPDFPPPVERLILRAMARKPEHRYASARDFSAAVLELMGTVPEDGQQRLAFIVAAITGSRRGEQEAFIRDLLKGLEFEQEERDLFTWATASESQLVHVEGLPALGQGQVKTEDRLDPAGLGLSLPRMLSVQGDHESLEFTITSESIRLLLNDLDALSSGKPFAGSSGVFRSASDDGLEPVLQPAPRRKGVETLTEPHAGPPPGMVDRAKPVPAPVTAVFRSGDTVPLRLAGGTAPQRVLEPHELMDPSGTEPTVEIVRNDDPTRPLPASALDPHSSFEDADQTVELVTEAAVAPAGAEAAASKPGPDDDD